MCALASKMCLPIHFHKLKTCNAGAPLKRSDKFIFTKQSPYSKIWDDRIGKLSNPACRNGMSGFRDRQAEGSNRAAGNDKPFGRGGLLIGAGRSQILVTVPWMVIREDRPNGDHAMRRCAPSTAGAWRPSNGPVTYGAEQGGSASHSPDRSERRPLRLTDNLGHEGGPCASSVARARDKLLLLLDQMPDRARRSNRDRRATARPPTRWRWNQSGPRAQGGPDDHP